eukprot:scaffold19466_cov129-Isochrysis_galbana.AAC.2
MPAHHVCDGGPQPLRGAAAGARSPLHVHSRGGRLRLSRARTHSGRRAGGRLSGGEPARACEYAAQACAACAAAPLQRKEESGAAILRTAATLIEQAPRCCIPSRAQLLQPPAPLRALLLAATGRRADGTVERAACS